MIYQILAELTVAVHGLFIAFAVTGGLMVLRRPRVAWVHVPAAAWAGLIELAGWICPLTPLENHFRRLAGEAGYAGGFIEHYVLPVIYPAGLTRGVQVALGAGVVVLNVAVYLWLWRRRADRESASDR